MSNLLYCPFCGGDVQFDEEDFKISCKQCPVEVYMYDTVMSRDEIEYAWNSRQPVEAIRRAIEDPGKVPEFHYGIMKTHRHEWPALWKAIDKLLEDK